LGSEAAKEADIGAHPCAAENRKKIKRAALLGGPQAVGDTRAPGALSTHDHWPKKALSPAIGPHIDILFAVHGSKSCMTPSWAAICGIAKSD
jgi:hypothetical protein